ncbi:hypothetical protein M5K25_020086 [Dendrobium thyrsiflorum]|uniref:Uncharacterized protein n=1 Tax=Dendrobium thyrsiflorum TaxID=117978 RepID=A0ABD0UGC1_DENTH
MEEITLKGCKIARFIRSWERHMGFACKWGADRVEGGLPIRSKCWTDLGSLQEKLNGEVSLYEIIEKKSGNFDDRIDADKHAFDGSQIFNKAEEKGTHQVPGFPTSGMYSQDRNAAGTSESTTSHQTIIQFVKISKAKSHKKRKNLKLAYLNVPF